ncbi:MAG TPA: ParB/RepB/Spo0J family partition protein [Candidatus Yonathbacteria bacterium]|nr:ParB/RepB/Spo0J family partition protein [Candidatus Yonathbacteria bacterium]
MNQNYNNSIFWIEVEKINPNPYQPRKEFDEGKLNDLAESIKQYGILQPLVATRREREKEDGGLIVEYELIAGERRLRASKIANLVQVPVIIRSGEDDDKLKLELAIIENLQREDLNPVDRARAFQKLAYEFRFKHVEIAKKVGKSREYVSNTLRLLALPEDMLNALAGRKITEGHTRPILMLADRPEEQATLFKEIIFKKLTVREAEGIARRIAQDRVRKKNLLPDPEIMEIEESLTEELGTRVQIDRKDGGGKIVIDFFSNDDLRGILNAIKNGGGEAMGVVGDVVVTAGEGSETLIDDSGVPEGVSHEEVEREEEKDEELYGLKNFSL